MSKGRTLPHWIESYHKYTTHTEPPTSYHTWTAISVIAGALQRKVGMRWGHDVIYPNMYIILVGPSGRCRKGTAISIGKDLLQQISGVTITSESITREALIRAMKGAVVNYQAIDGTIKQQCPITCISPELSVFLGQQDVKFIANLTDWYDSHNEWTYETKGAGIDRIQGVSFNLLGATAPDWLPSMLPQEAIGGGFTSRCIFVVEENKQMTIARPEFTPAMAKIREMLINDLQYIANLSGEIRFSDSAIQLYDDWYEAQEARIRAGKFQVDDPRFAGYCDRRATHIKKISIAVCAAQSNDLVITEKHFKESLRLMEAAERNMHKTFGGLGRSRYSESVQLVLDCVRKKGSITRSELLSEYYRDVDSTTLKVVEEVLEQMKVVKIVYDTINQEVRYEWIKKARSE